MLVGVTRTLKNAPEALRRMSDAHPDKKAIVSVFFAMTDLAAAITNVHHGMECCDSFYKLWTEGYNERITLDGLARIKEINFSVGWMLIRDVYLEPKTARLVVEVNKASVREFQAPIVVPGSSSSIDDTFRPITSQISSSLMRGGGGGGGGGGEQENLVGDTSFSGAKETPPMLLFGGLGGPIGAAVDARTMEKIRQQQQQQQQQGGVKRKSLLEHMAVLSDREPDASSSESQVHHQYKRARSSETVLTAADNNQQYYKSISVGSGGGGGNLESRNNDIHTAPSEEEKEPSVGWGAWLFGKTEEEDTTE